ncbi:MAG: metalloprotease PmbA [bacterium]
MSNQTEFNDAIELMLSEARRLGASASEAVISSNRGLSATVRLGEPETIEHTHDQGLGLSVYFGNRKGSASSTDLSPAAIRETVTKACTIARHTSEDPCNGLADAELMAADIPDLDLHHPWEIDTSTAIEIATACETAGRDQDNRVTNSDGATLNSGTGDFVYGNSHGFVHGYPFSRHSLSCSLVAQDGGDMQGDYWYDSSRVSSELASPESVGQRAASRALSRLNPKTLSTRTAPVIFDATMAAGLLRSFTGAIKGHAQYRKASFLLDMMNEQIFPEWVTIQERPHLLRGLSSAPFDNEGVATRNRELISHGILKSYVLDSYSACKLDMQSTGNAGGVRNLAITTGNQDQAALLKEMNTGFLVTEMMGQGLNPVTGDYSRGAAGFWIENGEIAYPVSEVTVAGNLRDVFQNLIAIGNDTDIPGSTHTGSWLVDELTIAGS